jgi:hypothetical protein
MAYVVSIGEKDQEKQNRSIRNAHERLTTAEADKVDGAASSTDKAAARFNGTTGKVIQNSALLIADTTGALSRSGNGGIPVQGTNTNDSAAAGDVGQVIESTTLVASAVTLTSGVAADVTSISLTAGDWDVWGGIFTNPGVGTTQSDTLAWISTTSATVPTRPNAGAFARMPFSAATGTDVSCPAGMRRYSLSSTTTVYLSCRSTFGVNTNGAYGYIGARRAR